MFLKSIKHYLIFLIFLIVLFLVSLVLERIQYYFNLTFSILIIYIYIYFLARNDI